MGKNNFDFLRFGFAFVVVLSHIIDLSLAPALRFLKPFLDTHVSVTGFFVISGFLISGSYFNTPNLSDYFVKRARRLLPAYVVVVLLSAFSLVLLSTLSAQQYFSSTEFRKFLISNLLFVNFLQPDLPGVFTQNTLGAVNGALWTIKIEVSFYLVLPLLLSLVKRSNSRTTLYVTYYLLGLAYNGLMLIMLQQFPQKAVIIDTLSHQLPGFLTYFSAGMLVYHLHDWLLKKQKYWLLPAFIVFIVEYYFSLEIMRPLAMALIILWFAFGIKYFNNFGKYGDFSYGIYIFHFPLIQSLVALNVFQTFNPFFVGITIIAMVLLIAIFSWNVIEKPFLKRKHPKAASH